MEPKEKLKFGASTFGTERGASQPSARSLRQKGREVSRETQVEWGGVSWCSPRHQKKTLAVSGVVGVCDGLTPDTASGPERRPVRLVRNHHSRQARPGGERC